MRLIRSALWISVILLIAGLLSDERSKVVWATPDKPEWDGWVDDVVRLRADRKNQPMVGYLYSEAVVWDDYHDINQSRLADGRILTLEWQGEEWAIIAGWAKGKELFLCYDEVNGASLWDPLAQKRFPVFGAWKNPGGFLHPIDDYLDSLEAYTTYDMMSAIYEARQLWRLEIDRVVRKVLAMKHLPKEVRAEFIALTAARVRYCELQGSFGSSAIHAGITGTAAGPLGLSYNAGIYREAYAQLANLADYLSAYDYEPGK